MSNFTDAIAATATAHQSRVEKASDELAHQIYQLGGGVEHISAMDAHNATIAMGYTRDETIAALNALINSDDIEAIDGWTGLVETVRLR